MFSIRGWWKFRGTRVVTCPDNHQAVALKVGGPDLEHLDVRQCSRWPEKLGCGQECLSQVKESPEGCLLHTYYTQWYQDKPCAVCGKKLEAPGIGEHIHPPALMASDGYSIEWNMVRPEELAQLMVTYRPICWDCHIAENFRHDHPEMITDRNFQR